MNTIPYTKFINAISTINRLTDFELYESNINLNFISSELLSGWPVLAHSNLKLTSNNKNYSGSTGFIIDAYRYYHSEYEEYMVWCDCGTPENCSKDFSEIADKENHTYEELVARFGKSFVKSTLYTNTQEFVAMNWCTNHYSFCDNIYISPYSSDWIYTIEGNDMHHTSIKIAQHK